MLKVHACIARDTQRAPFGLTLEHLVGTTRAVQLQKKKKKKNCSGENGYKIFIKLLEIVRWNKRRNGFVSVNVSRLHILYDA